MIQNKSEKTWEGVNIGQKYRVLEKSFALSPGVLHFQDSRRWCARQGSEDLLLHSEQGHVVLHHQDPGPQEKNGRVADDGPTQLSFSS